jgi:hypothetical protein
MTISRNVRFRNPPIVKNRYHTIIHCVKVNEYKRLIQEQEELQYFMQEGLFGYLIPAKWLKRWKVFVSYPEDDEDLKSEEIDLFSETSNVDVDKFNNFLGTDSSTIEEELSSEHPGPVDGSRFYEY